MLTNTILSSILWELQGDEYQVLVDGAIVKQIRFDEKTQMLILDTEETELEKGEHILWSAE
jgi:hypothetical protein